MHIYQFKHSLSGLTELFDAKRVEKRKQNFEQKLPNQISLIV